MNSKIVIGIAIGLIAGLVLGVFIGVLIISPSGILPSKTAVGTNNQVQVSGTVQSGVNGNTLYFQNVNESLLTSALIVNGQYSVLLIGGQSYNIYDFNPTTFEETRVPNSDFNPFYLPLGVTTFTENLVSS